MFSGSYIDNATLHVPDTSIDAYKAAEPWNGFKSIVSTEEGEEEPVITQCAKPSITIVNGKLIFDCETEGVSFNASYSYNSGNGNVTGNELILAGTTTAHVTVYAMKDGYLDSDVATADVELSVGTKGDVNQDGVVSITDAVSVVNIILGQ